MTGRVAHQGLVLHVPAYDYAHPDDLVAKAEGQPLIAALDSVTDPRNLGAVVRSAAAFGAHGVVVPERRAAGMTASAWKTSDGDVSLPDLDLADGPLVLVVGAEDAGLSRLVLETCDQLVSIPMTSGVES